MRFKLTEENFDTIKGKIEYYIHYHCGVFKSTKPNSSINSFSKGDIIFNANNILESYIDTDIVFTDKYIYIEKLNTYYLFLNGYDKVTLRNWVKRQVKNKTYLDEYVKFNYQVTFNKLSKYEIFEIILDYM